MRNIRVTLSLIAVLCLIPTLLMAQGQDTLQNTTNNLVLPETYPVSEPGELGAVVKRGSGSTELILIAGWGFGTEIFEEFMNDNQSKYTMYAVTLPGFSDTPPPSMPTEGSSYGEQIWTKNAVDGVVKLIRDKGLEKPVVLGHFITSTQVAMRLAINHPEMIGGVIIAGGSAKVVNPKLEKPPTLEERIQINDTYYGPKWFKEISEKNWDEGNYPPVTYSKSPALAQELWNTSAEVILPVMIQYLLEFYASDLSLQFNDIKVPTLVMIPSFNEKVIKEYSFLKHNFQDSWEGAEKINPLISVEKVNNSHLFIMSDRPEYFRNAVESFLTNIYR